MGRLVRQGCKGADVRAIQDVLNFHIRRLAPLALDGDFGPRTHARVVEFQKSNQLTADEIVGPTDDGQVVRGRAAADHARPSAATGIDVRWAAARHPTATSDPAIAAADAASNDAILPSSRLVRPAFRC